MDTNNQNKGPIKLKRLHLNKVNLKILSQSGQFDRNFLPKESGTVYAHLYSEWLVSAFLQQPVIFEQVESKSAAKRKIQSVRVGGLKYTAHKRES